MSTQPKFTPGPWSVCTVDGDNSILSIEQDRESLTNEEPSIIGEVDLSGDGIDADVGTANARLIAAAPDLYAELESISASLSMEFPNWQATVLRIDALLAKARGESTQ